MNTKKTIEKLKDPEQAQPFCLRSPEEQFVLKRAGKKNCLWLCDDSEWNRTEAAKWILNHIYILKPDYEPEPEYEDIEVIILNNETRLKEECPNSQYNYLWWAIFDKDFIGFFSENDMLVRPEAIATRIHNGEKIVARFRGNL